MLYGSSHLADRQRSPGIGTRSAVWHARQDRSTYLNPDDGLCHHRFNHLILTTLLCWCTVPAMTLKPGQKQRRYPASVKAKVYSLYIDSKFTVAEISKQTDVPYQLIYKWAHREGWKEKKVTHGQNLMALAQDQILEQIYGNAARVVQSHLELSRQIEERLRSFLEEKPDADQSEEASNLVKIATALRKVTEIEQDIIFGRKGGGRSTPGRIDQPRLPASRGTMFLMDRPTVTIVGRAQPALVAHVEEELPPLQPEA